jgi:hypothetical protein
MGGCDNTRMHDLVKEGNSMKWLCSDGLLICHSIFLLHVNKVVRWYTDTINESNIKFVNLQFQLQNTQLCL